MINYAELNSYNYLFLFNLIEGEESAVAAHQEIFLQEGWVAFCRAFFEE